MKVPIVDDKDNFLYFKEIEDKTSEEINRVVGLWIINENNEVLIARRSKNEKILPDLWGPSVTGGVEEGETYESNLVKEAEEELGLILENFIKGPKQLLFRNSKFFAHWFFAKVSSDTNFTLLENEVDEVRWVSISDLRNWHSREPELFLPFFMNDVEVLKDYENQN